MGVKCYVVCVCNGLRLVHAMAINVHKAANHGVSGHHLEIMGTPQTPTSKSGDLHIIGVQ